MTPHILIVGIGGRTGSMFAKELGGVVRVTGAGLDREVGLIKQGGVIIRAGDLAAEALDVSAILADGYQQSAGQLAPDYIFLATRNPIAEIVKIYYRPFVGQKKIPALIVSQNGVSAINDAKESLVEIFGSAADNIGIIRVSLIDPVDARIIEGKVNIFYRLPVRLGFGGVGNTDVVQIAEVFKNAGFETEQFFGAKVLAMERTKLFMNLIGMAGAAAGMTVDEGLADPEIFIREVLMLREYAAVIKKNKGSFLTLSGYPIGQISFLLNNVPMPLLVALRRKLINIVAKHRNSKSKNMGEIDYYNGEVVRLGNAVGVPTPINEMIVCQAKDILSKTALEAPK